MHCVYMLRYILYCMHETALENYVMDGVFNYLKAKNIKLFVSVG